MNIRELQKILAKYKIKKEFIIIFGNGVKGKFDKYLVDYFLIGKMDKAWMKKLITRKYEE